MLFEPIAMLILFYRFRVFAAPISVLLVQAFPVFLSIFSHILLLRSFGFFQSRHAVHIPCFVLFLVSIILQNVIFSTFLQVITHFLHILKLSFCIFCVFCVFVNNAQRIEKNKRGCNISLHPPPPCCCYRFYL